LEGSVSAAGIVLAAIFMCMFVGVAWDDLADDEGDE
jgi:hypothetical protein